MQWMSRSVIFISKRVLPLSGWLSSWSQVFILFAIGRWLRVATGPVALGSKGLLIVRTDGLGDIVLFTPFLRELRRLNPTTSICMVTSPVAAGLLKTCPYVHETLVVNCQSRLFEAPWSTLRRVWPIASHIRHHVRPTVAISARWDVDWYGANAVCYLSGAPERILHRTADQDIRSLFNGGHERLFSRVVTTDIVKHEVLRNLDFLKRLARSDVRAPQMSTDLEVWLTESDREWARAALKRCSQSRFIALAPGAGAPRREWPVSSFAELANRLHATDSSFEFVLIGGPSENGMMARLATMMTVPPRIVQNEAIRRVAAVIEQCDLFIGNDTGTTHVASAVGCSTIMISCHPEGGDIAHPNSPVRFSPWARHSAVVRPKAARTHDCKLGCVKSEAHCIVNVAVDEVLDRAMQLAYRGAERGAT